MCISCAGSYKSPVIYALIHRTKNYLWCNDLLPHSRGIQPTETHLVLLKLRSEAAPRLAAKPELQVRARFLPYFAPPPPSQPGRQQAALPEVLQQMRFAFWRVIHCPQRIFSYLGSVYSCDDKKEKLMINSIWCVFVFLIWNSKLD